MRHRLVLTRLFFAVVAVTAGCSSGGGTTSPPTTAPTLAPSSSASPSTAPSSSASPSTSPSSSPSSAPTTVPQTWTFGGSTASGSFTSGTAPGAVSLSSYHSISVSVQFAAPSSGSGTLQFSDALNGALSVSDVTPNTLPADNATSGYTPIIYLSTYNGTTGTINFGTAIPTITVGDTSLNGTYTSCNFDVYGKQSGSTYSWFIAGNAGTPSASGVTVGGGALGGGNTVDFQPGQQIVAVSCH